MSDLTKQIIIIIVTLLVALGVGLVLRYLLVRRLKKTILDNWLVQIFGVLIIIPPIIVGIIVAAAFIGIQATQMLTYLQLVLPGIFNIPNFGQLIWNLLLSIFIFLFAIGVARTITKLIDKKQTENHLNINVRTLLKRASYVGALIIAFLFILAIWNIQFGIPAAVISVITVGLTFVLQDLLRNLVAGIYLLIEGPFQIGDKITTQQSILFSNIVINKTFYKNNRVIIIITMPLEQYNEDQTSECMLTAVKGVTGVIAKPEPSLALSIVAGAFGSSTGTVSGYSGEIVTLTLRFWTPEGADTIVSDVMNALHAAVPQADLSIREPPGL